MSEKVENPLFEALEAITGKRPPDFLLGKFSVNELNDDESYELQTWCICNSRPTWSTGIGIIEAAESIVSEAVSNRNIDKKPLP